MTHTKGPWIVGFSADNNIHCVDARDSEGLYFEVCEVWGVKSDKIEEPESHANARLIAAAPELLAVLTAVDDMWSDDGEGGRCNPINARSETVREIWEQIRGVIAKAVQS